MVHFVFLAFLNLTFFSSFFDTDVSENICKTASGSIRKFVLSVWENVGVRERRGDCRGGMIGSGVGGAEVSSTQPSCLPSFADVKTPFSVGQEP